MSLLIMPIKFSAACGHLLDIYLEFCIHVARAAFFSQGHLVY
jgi:hypothetical protein